MMDTFPTERAFALEQDREDPLVRFREEFYTPPDTIYLDGNSLGLLPREAERSLLRILKEWKEIGINGWLEGRPPWFYFAERVGEQMAPLVGAQPSEVIATGTTTANIHALLSSFFHPSGTRTRILADSENFPSDLYALKSHLRLHGLDPKTHLITIGAGDDLMIDEDRIISAMGRETALVFLPSVLFRTGQLLDIGRISRAAAK